MMKVVGIDEAGRGPLAGPVAVGVVAVPVKHQAYVHERLAGIRDSKKLSPQKRRAWFKVAKDLQQSGYLSYTVSLVGAGCIDEKGITSAVQTAIARSLNRLALSPPTTRVFLDGGLRAVYENNAVDGRSVPPAPGKGRTPATGIGGKGA